MRKQTGEEIFTQVQLSWIAFHIADTSGLSNVEMKKSGHIYFLIYKSYWPKAVTLM